MFSSFVFFKAYESNQKPGTSKLGNVGTFFAQTDAGNGLTDANTTLGRANIFLELVLK